MTIWRTLSDGRRVPISNPREEPIDKPERVASGFRRGVFGHAPKKGKRKPSILTEYQSSAGEAICPICGEKTYFVRAKNGGSFWCDVLGIPWTPHPCMKHEKFSKEVIRLARNNLELVGTVFKIVTLDRWEKPNLVHIKTLDGGVYIIKTEADHVEGLLGKICGVMDTSIFSIGDSSTISVRLWRKKRLKDSFYDGLDDKKIDAFLDKVIIFLHDIFLQRTDEKEFFRFLHKQPLKLKIFCLKHIINLFDSNLKFKYKNTDRGWYQLKAVISNLEKLKKQASKR